MAAPMVAYGLPILYQAIASSGAFSLSGSFTTSGILTRVGIEVGFQSLGNVASLGFNGIGEIDLANVVLAGTGLNFIGSSLIRASVDYTPFSSDGDGAIISLNKKRANFAIDLGTGVTLGGTKNLMNSISTNKLVIGLFNASVTTGSSEAKRNEK